MADLSLDREMLLDIAAVLLHAYIIQPQRDRESWRKGHVDKQGRTMASGVTIIVAYVGAITGVCGGIVAFASFLRTVGWKRAELASGYVKQLNDHEELVFACRSLDWNGGFLVVPESLQPLLRDGSKTIQHDREIMHNAMLPALTISELEADPRLQIYRTAIDSLLSWLSLVNHALRRGLFKAEDIRIAGYWVAKVDSAQWLQGFVKLYYAEEIDQLNTEFESVRPASMRKLDYQETQKEAERVNASQQVERAPPGR